MANTYHQVYIQTVFAPKYRNAVLAEELQPKIFGIIGNLINETGCKTIIVNGVEDHVHCFLGLKPTVSISELMKIVKAKSSKSVNEEHLMFHRFEWQEGYSAFSYSHSDRDRVYQYVANQKEHHKKFSFREEYKMFLNEFKIHFEEKYIFKDPI